MYIYPHNQLQNSTGMLDMFPMVRYSSAKTVFHLSFSYQWHWHTAYYTAAYYPTAYYTAALYTAVYYTAAYYPTAYYTAAYYTAAYYTAVYYTAAYYTAVYYRSYKYFLSMYIHSLSNSLKKPMYRHTYMYMLWASCFVLPCLSDPLCYVAFPCLPIILWMIKVMHLIMRFLFNDIL